MMGEIVTRNV